MITTLQPTAGEALVFGHDVVTEAYTVRRLIGYVPQERAIDRFLTGREHLELLGALYHLSKQDALRRIGELLRLVGLEEHADRTAKTYSGGMKRKLDIACGLLPNPKILFLDEPTLGLDVQSRMNIWDYVRRLRDEGITIVLTTITWMKQTSFADRLAIIDGGRIRIIGSPKELKAGLGGDGVFPPDWRTGLPHGGQVGYGIENPSVHSFHQSQIQWTGYSSGFSRKKHCPLSSKPRIGLAADLTVLNTPATAR